MNYVRGWVSFESKSTYRDGRGGYCSGGRGGRMVTVCSLVAVPEAAAPPRVREHERGLHEVVVRFDGVTRRGRRLGGLALSQTIHHTKGKKTQRTN